MLSTRGVIEREEGWDRVPRLSGNFPSSDLEVEWGRREGRRDLTVIISSKICKTVVKS